MSTTGYYNYDGVWLAFSATPTKTIWGSGTSTIVATAGAVELYSSGQGELMLGGAGDDTFVIGSLLDQVVAGSSGVDTVIATVNFILPSGVQNLTLNGTWNNVVGIGNGMANIITADVAGETIMGAGGDDVIVSAGGDTFLYAPGAGKDVIIGFHTGATNSDVVRLTGYGFTSFAQVQSAMTQVGSDVVLKLSPADLIDFKNTTIANFTAANFQMQAATGGMAMAFDDEFNSLSLYNSTTKTGTWLPYFDWSAYSALNAHTVLASGELEVYVDPNFAGSGTTALGLNPFSISNGVLTITARPTPTADQGLLWSRAYTSGMITTKPSFSQTYGYFEIKAEFPSTPVGLWPAFWLLPADNKGDNEIDVFEQVNDQANTVHQTVHWDTAAGAATYTSFPTYVPNLLTGFHTYGVLWTASTITWFVDGAAVGQVATPYGMNKAMYMVTNLAVGGNWPGSPDSTTKFPAAYQVDYVRAYSLSANTAVSYAASASGGDTFFVHNSADTLTVPAGTANEAVIADVSYVLPANIQKLTLTGAGLTGTGNSVADVLTSSGGANTLVAGSGVDTFYVNSVGDQVVAPASQVGDSVIASVSYAAPANIKILTVNGSGLTATANSLGDALTSTGGANTLVGGSGADTFYVNNTGDKVVIASSANSDVIISSVSYALPDNAHVLRLTGTGLTGTGDAAGGNYMSSISGGNTLIGGAGGNDVFSISHSNDVIQVAAGTPNETVNAWASYVLPANVQNLVGQGAGALTLVGNTMDNVITAGKGADVITGGGGNDTFVVAPGDKLETITDFLANGAQDQIDITSYQKSGITETFVDHGTYASINFSNGDEIDLTGGHAATLYVNGHYIV